MNGGRMTVLQFIFWVLVIVVCGYVSLEILWRAGLYFFGPR